MAMWVGREEEIPAYRLAHNQEATPATLGLFQACEAGDSTKVAEFLKQGGRANYFDDIKGGTTPVHAACTLPKDSTALEALVAFAKTEPGDDLKPLFDLPSTVLKATPLHCAAEVGNSAQLEVLLKLGVDANGENAYGDTPLLVACANNQAECVKLLLEHNADPTKANHKKQNALHMAVAGLGKALRSEEGKENDSPALIEAQLLVAKRLLADPKVALVNMGSAPMRHSGVESGLAGGAGADAASVAGDDVDPPEDLNADAEYRRHLARVLVGRGIAEASA